MDNDRTKQENEFRIGLEIERFINDINSLADALPILKTAIEAPEVLINKETVEFSKELIQKMKSASDKNARELLFENNIYNLYRNLSHVVRFTSAKELIMRSLIISLVSQYDAFLSKLIHTLFLRRPETLNLSEKIITFSQLQSFENIEDIREYILEQEIETVLFKSHIEQIEWIEKKYNVSLQDKSELWSTFIEITERRNIFVHNSGMVSRHYLNACKKHNVKLPENIRIGQKLDVTADYFTSAHQCIFEIGVKIAQILWRKILPKDLEAADGFLIHTCYMLLDEERFNLACTLLDFATTIKQYANEKNKRMFIINKAQAHKWAGNPEKAKETIIKEDWSAASDDLQLATAVILDDFTTANYLVKKIGTSGSIRQSHYRQWPLFKEYRKSEHFIQIFEEIFQEPFHIVEQDYLFKISEDLEIITNLNPEILEGTQE